MPDDSYLQLPEDPKLAFLHIEREFRALLERKVHIGDENSPWFEWHQDYSNHVLGAARSLEIEEFDSLVLPTDINNYHRDYRAIVLAVDRLAIEFRINQSRRINKYSVALDTVAKSKIRHRLVQLRSWLKSLRFQLANERRL